MVDLLRSVRHLCDGEGEPEAPGKPARPVSDLVMPFPETEAPDDSIIDVLDKMIEHGVSLVPVMEAGKLKAVVRLADVFGTMAAVLFGEEDPSKEKRLARHSFLGNSGKKAIS